MSQDNLNHDNLNPNRPNRQEARRHKRMSLRHIKPVPQGIEPYQQAIHAAEIVLNPNNMDPDNQADIAAEITLTHLDGGSVYRTPDNQLFAVSFPFPVYPKHGGQRITLSTIPVDWDLVTNRH